MSLKDAIEEIANQMEEDLPEIGRGGDLPPALVKGYVRQLRSAIKAAGNQPANSGFINPMALGTGEGQHAIAIEAAKAEFRAKKEENLSRVEEKAPEMRLCCGGLAEGEMAPLDPSMPVGARTEIQGAVYELRQDGRLYAILSVKE